MPAGRIQASRAQFATISPETMTCIASLAYNPRSFGDSLVIEDIRRHVAEAFNQVDNLIVKHLRSDVDMVESIGHYIVDAGGKRLRPLLVLLTAQALGQVTTDQCKFAAVVEFIHTATLLHDDVVDLSALRRGRPTANAQFGNAPSVLVGDFIYTRAFQLMVQLDNMALLSHMADTTNTIAEGEVLQLVRAGDAASTEDQYLAVIERKTAALFAAACRGAAILAGAPLAQQEQLYQFGLNLGIAFQMIDDVLDYIGDPAVTGKQIGDDLNEGKPTLPLIHVMREGSAEHSALVRTALETKSSEALTGVLNAVAQTGSIDYTRQRAETYKLAAMKALSALDESPSKDALKQLADLSTQRAH